MGHSAVALLTVKQLARYLGVHEQTVYDMARKGELPSIRIGRSWRFDVEAVRTALDVSNGAEPGST